MISQTKTASKQFRKLLNAYIDDERDEAILNLREAFREAASIIEANPGIGGTHPRPYPEVACKGFLWIDVKKYWIGYSMTKGYPIITNIHYATSNIPANVASEDDEIPLNA